MIFTILVLLKISLLVVAITTLLGAAITTAQRMKFSIKDFFSQSDQIHRKLRTWSHLLKKSLIEKIMFWGQ